MCRRVDVGGAGWGEGLGAFTHIPACVGNGLQICA